jgi:hypothetical protein
MKQLSNIAAAASHAIQHSKCCKTGDGAMLRRPKLLLRVFIDCARSGSPTLRAPSAQTLQSVDPILIRISKRIQGKLN